MGPAMAPTILLTTKNEYCTFIDQKSVIQFFKGVTLFFLFFGGELLGQINFRQGKVH